ncbi:MAG: hypothetical protein M5U28_46100 [Sandaracinaceae bacterium]|nr:hypothetical protein [Sandaracinaceae bacterium]
MVFALHLLLGERIGAAPFVEWRELHDTTPYRILAAIYSVAPVASTTLAAFVLGTIVQEFWRGTAVRMRTAKESAPVAFAMLVSRARRRYGGYVVHLGIVCMFFGFTGTAWDEEREASLRPGQSMEVGGYEFRYDGVRMEVDTNKRAIYADLTILEDGEEIGHASPAKFIYRTHPEMPTTEVAIRTTAAHDLYMIMSTVDPDTHRAAFRIMKHPLVVWIWIGGGFLLLGVFISTFPRLSELAEPSREASPDVRARSPACCSPSWSRARSSPRGSRARSRTGRARSTRARWRSTIRRSAASSSGSSASAATASACRSTPAAAAGPRGCARSCAAVSLGATRSPRSSTTTATASARAPSRSPPTRGLDRALWALPIAGILIAALGIVFGARRWARAGREQTEVALREDTAAKDGEYDERLEEELRRLEGD